MERGLLVSGEEPQQQVITRDDSITSNMAVSSPRPIYKRMRLYGTWNVHAVIATVNYFLLVKTIHCHFSTYREALHVQLLHLVYHYTHIVRYLHFSEATHTLLMGTEYIYHQNSALRGR